MTDRSQSSLEILTKARELLSDPRRWTQGAFARNAHDEPVNSASSQALCFCSIGAIKVAARFDHKATDLAISALGALVGRDGDLDEYDALAAFNDSLSTKHGDVLTAFDKAIELVAQSQGSEAAGPNSPSPSTGL